MIVLLEILFTMDNKGMVINDINVPGDDLQLNTQFLLIANPPTVGYGCLFQQPPVGFRARHTPDKASVDS